jgi:hypothetical protein
VKPWIPESRRQGLLGGSSSSTELSGHDGSDHGQGIETWSRLSSVSIPVPAPGSSITHKRASSPEASRAGIHLPHHEPSEVTQTLSTSRSVRTKASAVVVGIDVEGTHRVPSEVAPRERLLAFTQREREPWLVGGDAPLRTECRTGRDDRPVDVRPIELALDRSG